jgi:hypothetical protein
MTDDIEYSDCAEACQLAITSLESVELSGVGYEEVAFFTAAKRYCTLQVELRAINTRIAELEANGPTTEEMPDGTPSRQMQQGSQSQSQTALARTRGSHTQLPRSLDSMESSLADAQTDQARLTMRLEAARKEAECALRRWTMLCFWECCEGGECSHVQEATRSLSFLREADKVAKGNPEAATQEPLLQTLCRYREELTTHLADAMQASKLFANLMCERAGKLYRDFLAVLIDTFARVVELVEEERNKPPRPRFT